MGHNDARTAVNCDTSLVNSGRVRMGYLGSRVTNWPIGNHFFSFRVHRPPSHGPWQLKSGITSNVCCPFPRHRRRSCSLKGDDKEKNRKHVITQYSFFSKDDDLGDERARSHKGKALLGLTWLQAATKKVKHWRDLDLKALKSRGLAGTLAYGFLNSVYYGLGIIFVWIFISQVPKGLSLNEFTQTLMRVAAYTWVSKIFTNPAKCQTLHQYSGR